MSLCHKCHIGVTSEKDKKERNDVKLLQLKVFLNEISTSTIYHTNFILTLNNHWYDFAFCSALSSSLICLSWRQESFFLTLIVLSGLLTCQAMLVLHLCRFQQLQHLYYWDHHHLCHHHYLKTLNLDHSVFFQRYSVTQALTEVTLQSTISWENCGKICMFQHRNRHTLILFCCQVTFWICIFRWKVHWIPHPLCHLHLHLFAQKYHILQSSSWSFQR